MIYDFSLVKFLIYNYSFAGIKHPRIRNHKSEIKNYLFGFSQSSVNTPRVDFG